MRIKGIFTFCRRFLSIRIDGVGCDGPRGSVNRQKLEPSSLSALSADLMDGRRRLHGTDKTPLAVRR